MFESILGEKSFLGIDIGTTSIKVAEISKSSKQPRLTNYGILESFGHLKRLNDAFQTSSLKLAVRGTVLMLKTLLKKADFGTEDVIASIPAFSAFVTVLELPGMSPQETESALKFQIPQYIPLAPEEMSIDWQKIEETEDEKGMVKQRILLTAVPNEKVAAYKEIFKQAGLKLKYLEVESLSLIRALAPGGDSASLVVDIGSRATNIVVARQGLLKYNYQTDFAGFSLTQAVANGLQIDIKRAEEMKKQRGILVKTVNQELSTLTLPFLDVIINEVKRSRDNYEKSGDAKVERIVLAGGGAKMLGIEDYFSEQIGLPAAVGNPFVQVAYSAEVEPMIKDLAPSFSVAVGLGIKNFINTD
ncbi:type IV pilus assembly protein PilM [Candidatus Wolfebacteria bacterium]|nr:type IV pilus assembly protein PilM [Candidatus Wolfebacteria bacterium]